MLRGGYPINFLCAYEYPFFFGVIGSLHEEHQVLNHFSVRERAWTGAGAGAGADVSVVNASGAVHRAS